MDIFNSSMYILYDSVFNQLPNAKIMYSMLKMRGIHRTVLLRFHWCLWTQNNLILSMLYDIDLNNNIQE